MATELPGRAEAVTVAYVCQNNVTYSWHRSMMEMVGYDSAHEKRIATGGFIAIRCGTDGLMTARNKGVQEFLEQDSADWLFWVDTDMGFLPDTVDRLMEAADPVARPMMGALCFSQREEESDSMGGYRTLATPTVLDWANVDGKLGWKVRFDFQPNAVTRVGGTGAACVLIHRSVFEKVEKAHGRVWYDRVPNTTTGELIGEDLSFCLRAGALDVPIHVHTGVPTTHFKQVWLGEEQYYGEAMLRQAAKAFAAEQEPSMLTP